MPKKAEMMLLMKDSTRFSDSYRESNIDEKHKAADNAYHGVLENLEEYKKRGRSCLFIPTTRDHVRRWVTTVVNAFYVSDDIVSLQHPDPYKQLFTNEVFNLRLELYTSFFTFLSQAAHAHVKYGNAIAKTGWEYADGYRMEYDEEAGQKKEIYDPLVDRPFFELVPFENLMYDYRVIGTDPMQSSPYLRHWVPYYINDVEEKFKAKTWKKPRDLNYGRVKSRASADSVRQARAGSMTDPQAEDFNRSYPDGSSYDQVWVVENYFRMGGTDWTWMSLGDEYIVTDAVRTYDKFTHHKRPFVLSQFDSEAFRSYSDGLPELFKDLQAEQNAIRNQRRDNVALVLNCGHYVRRGAGINLASLQSSRPARIVLGDRIGQDDIRREEVSDVTASSYREEEITERDIEKISQQSGNRLGATAASRTTATEAAISAASTGEMEGFIVKGFVETFVRPLLEMFMDNVSEYETDDDVLAKAAVATGLPPARELITRCEVVINAGMGSTNKEIRSMRLERVIDRMTQAQISPLEVMREWLPLVGLKNANRMLPPPQQQGGAAPPGQAGGVGQGALAPGGNAGEESPLPGQSPGLNEAAQDIPNFGGYAGAMVGAGGMQ